MGYNRVPTKSRKTGKHRTGKSKELMDLEEFYNDWPNWTVEIIGTGQSSDADAYPANWMRAPSTVDIHNIDAKPEIDCTVEEGTWVKLKGSCTKTNWMDFVDQVGRDDEASDGEGEDDDNFVNDYEPGSKEVAAANDVVEADSADGPGALV